MFVTLTALALALPPSDPPRAAVPPGAAVPPAARVRRAAAADSFVEAKYEAVLEAVRGGSRMVLCVNVPAPADARYCPVFPAGFKNLRDGVYDCFPGPDGAPSLQNRDGKPAFRPAPGRRFIRVSAAWCKPCQQLAAALADLRVGRALSGFTRTDVDLDSQRAQAQALQVTGVPTLIVTDGAGRELARRSGYVPPEELERWLAEFAEPPPAAAPVPPPAITPSSPSGDDCPNGVCPVPTR